MPRTYQIVQETLIPKPLSEVFPFFADAANLNRLTPPELQFHILSPLPISMREGTLIRYRIKLFGLPMTWVTRIDSWEPGRVFVDSQMKGPYKLWRHTHTFEEREGQTWMRDVVDYQVPGGIFSPWVHRIFVRNRLERIFQYRTGAIQKIFGK